MKAVDKEGAGTLSIKRKALMVMSILALETIPVAAQQMFDNFEGERNAHYFVPKNWGKLDSMAVNPKQDAVNSSAHCAMYTRSRQRYDFIKIHPQARMLNAGDYAKGDASAAKITMKVLTDAPVGTLIEIQLGKTTGPAYPDGTHSQYQARTTVSGSWEELEFTFSQVPKGSQTTDREVNQMTLLFMPNSNKVATFYFDDLTGPTQKSGTSAGAGKKKLFNLKRSN